MSFKPFFGLLRDGRLAPLLRIGGDLKSFYRLTYLAAAGEAGLLQRLASGPATFDSLAEFFSPRGQGREALDAWLLPARRTIASEHEDEVSPSSAVFVVFCQYPRKREDRRMRSTLSAQDASAEEVGVRRIRYYDSERVLFASFIRRRLARSRATSPVRCLDALLRIPASHAPTG